MVLLHHIHLKYASFIHYPLFHHIISVFFIFKLCNNKWFDVWFMIADDNNLMNIESELEVVELLVVFGVDAPSYFFLGCQVEQVLCQRMVFMCI